MEDSSILEIALAGTDYELFAIMSYDQQRLALPK
jgi:hypothetical protein